MKQFNVFYKVVIIFMLMLTGCGIIPDIEQRDDSQPATKTVNMDKGNEDTEYSYSISLVDTSKFMDLPWRDELSFKVIQIKNMPEDKLPLENIVNQNIKNAMTSWVRGKVVNPPPDSIRLDIVCHSGRYLSFKNSFVYEGVHEDFIDDYVTIDIKSGQRVLLDDLVDINENFAKFLLEHPNIIKEPTDLEPWQGVPELNKYYSVSELLDELNKCSFTQEELIENGYAPIEESMGPLIGRNSFFLRDGMLVISFWKGAEELISLDVDDIKEFLKVDEW